MSDRFATHSDTLIAPATRAVAIATSDSTDLVDIPKALYVGVGGDITMIGVNAPAGSAGVLWKNVPAGSLIPFRARRVLATGTSAASILALY